MKVMERLGFSRFGLAGHDRGGRVAYRVALDHPDRVDRLAVLDILPTSTVWDRADARLALGYWPWSLLTQPEPLPECILTAGIGRHRRQRARRMGFSRHCFPADVRDAYAESLGDAPHAHPICEEYRAAATIDREHDAADREHGRRIVCPLLALWSAYGALETWYRDAGGPITLWRAWANDVRGLALDAGHFFPEEAPDQTADALSRFFEADVEHA